VEQTADVGNCAQDEIAIRPVNGIELDVRVPNANLPAFSNQTLEQADYRAFAQIVGVLLNARPTTPSFPGRSSAA